MRYRNSLMVGMFCLGLQLIYANDWFDDAYAKLLATGQQSENKGEHSTNTENSDKADVKRTQLDNEYIKTVLDEAIAALPKVQHQQLVDEGHLDSKTKNAAIKFISEAIGLSKNSEFIGNQTFKILQGKTPEVLLTTSEVEKKIKDQLGKLENAGVRQFDTASLGRRLSAINNMMGVGAGDARTAKLMEKFPAPESATSYSARAAIRSSGNPPKLDLNNMDDSQIDREFFIRDAIYEYFRLQDQLP
jgi:hypothetical protein